MVVGQSLSAIGIVALCSIALSREATPVVILSREASPVVILESRSDPVVILSHEAAPVVILSRKAAPVVILSREATKGSLSTQGWQPGLRTLRMLQTHLGQF